ncbi:capsular polysaccharide synthesis protein [Actinoplanes friuliensis]|uniref:Putative capsular polysaccharide synthesis protein n=1 Tax=Actinoplanes friuliensis DSM 7358 TaxID=1246995 RepID=U5VRW4_9ACTN|nr:capsular polysaccharide synthesis protein [Actinoplanes friuliensis]AGZ39569.1 putative capsular polysaccharide synthesis protein [Actinoplanes friuliensis DSM 7358]
MRPNTSGLRRRLTQAATGNLRLPASRAARLVAGPAPVVNLAPNPSFRSAQADGTFDQPLDAGGVYVHFHSAARSAPVPGLGVTGALVTGSGTNNDSHIAPGGRDESQDFRLGLRAGGTYTASVSVFLTEPLTGAINPYALRIIPGCVRGGTANFHLTASPPARNEYGDHRISVTFTLPENATAAWVRLLAGMSQGHGQVYWHSFSLTEGEQHVTYFDGDTEDDNFFTYEWLGEPGASASRRTLRAYQEILTRTDRQGVADEAARLSRAGEAAEADLLVAALAGELDPISRLTTARRLRDRDEIPQARQTLRKMIKAGDEHGDAAFELGRLHERKHDWAGAEQLYRDAVEKKPGDSERFYRLAYTLDKLKRRDESKQTSRQGLAVDGELPFDGPAVLDLDVKCFGARREIGIFLSEHLDQIRTQARQRLDRPARTALEMPIFVYWAQGFESAPALVKRCVAELRANNPQAQVHELSDTNLGYYVDMPVDLVTALGDNKTNFSDLVRLALLEKFGGIWVDATVYAPKALSEPVGAALGDGDFFAFNYHGPYISNWFLAARPGSYVAHLWRAAMYLWWEKRGELIEYFLAHHIFEMLYHLDADFAAEWDKGNRVSTRPAHALQVAMLQPYEPESFERLLTGSFAHKLRYKYQPQQVMSDSNLAHLVRGDHRI